MALKLMYITNSQDIAGIAQANGVDRIFIDMEYIGKNDRQGGRDSVKNHHTIDDVLRLRPILNKSDLLVRVNPIHNATSEYSDSEEEIDAVMKAGADIIMLPMAKTPSELERFVRAVNGRARTLFLLETAKACDNVDEMLSVPGINEVHIGLNDLHLDKGKKFMFELLCDGTVENLCRRIGEKNIPYGFGGIARLGHGMLPAENIIAEHYRMGSSMAILSRSFCNIQNIDSHEEIAGLFENELKKIRQYESRLEHESEVFFEQNKNQTKRLVDKIVRELGN